MKAVSFACLMLLASFTLHAQQARPPSSNPLQTLPKVEIPKQQPSVTVHVRQKRNARLRRLLGRYIQPMTFGIAGIRSLDFDRVAALFRPLRGHRITIGRLLEVVRKCTALYRQKGYPLSFCYLPDQRFEHGRIRVQAVEGYVAAIEIDGDPGALKPEIRAIAAHIMGERPLRRATFERYVQIMGLLPGIKVKVDAPPPVTTDGATRLKLSVQHKRFDSSIGLDFNHPGIQGLVTGMLDAPTSLGDQLQISALYPRGRYDQTYYAVRYALPLYSDGLYLRLGGSRFRGRPDNGGLLVESLRHDVRQDRLSASLRYPLWLDNHHSLFVNSTLYGADQSDRYRNVRNAAALQIDTNTRVVELGMDYAHAGNKQRREFSLQVAKGLGGLGASARVRANVATGLDNRTDVRFTRVTLTASQSNQWNHRFGTVFRLSGQYSPDRLPISERISFGGQRFASAYDTGIASGDSGWAGAMEWNRSFLVKQGWFAQRTPYLLAQYARTYNRDPLSRSDTLVSVALGLRLSDRQHYSIDMSIAKPLRDRPSGDSGDNRGLRGNLSFAYRFP